MGAKGTDGRIAGDWSQSGLRGVLGARQPTGTMDGPNGTSINAYAAPWLQAGKWGQMGGLFSGATQPAAQAAQDAALTTGATIPATGTVADTSGNQYLPAPNHVDGSSPYSAAAPPQGTIRPDPYGYETQTPAQRATAGYQSAAYPQGQPAIPAGTPGRTPDGPVNYNGTPLKFYDGYSPEPWVWPGTVDKYGYPNQPSKVPGNLPAGYSYGDVNLNATPRYVTGAGGKPIALNTAQDINAWLPTVNMIPGTPGFDPAAAYYANNLQTLTQGIQPHQIGGVGDAQNRMAILQRGGLMPQGMIPTTYQTAPRTVVPTTPKPPVTPPKPPVTPPKPPAQPQKPVVAAPKPVVTAPKPVVTQPAGTRLTNPVPPTAPRTTLVKPPPPRVATPLPAKKKK